VTESRHDEQVVQAWNEHRPYLVDLAFRMLGDIGAAEDVVQDAFARLLRARPGEIDDERGWLIVVTSRLCLDQIRSARSRRERPHDAGEIEFVTGTPDRSAVGPQQEADPADRITLDDDVQLALLVMLQRLSPAERVVFVLHDIFAVPFGEVAQTLGRPAATCRQLARRARQKIEGASTIDVAAVEHRAVTERFIAACASGDLNGLLEVLAPDVWGDFDAGPDGPRTVVNRGADRVARNLLRYLGPGGPGTTLVTHPLVGHPAVLVFTGRTLFAVLIFTMKAGRIQAIHGVGDPRKLALVSAQLG
jgi:RNA polymerase sigma-70 factor, ECF subfamily